ncbi:MAG: methylated-DNA--[protein]-cysteine S-methyltransferase [Ethanoligenens sp.]
MMTLYCASMNSPIGKLTCICDDVSIIRLLWAADNEDEAFKELSCAWENVQITDANETAATVCRELQAYFDGHLKQFSVHPAFVSGSVFARKIWAEVANIPYGKTISYQKLAENAHLSGARAAGNAVGRNPIPILVPCHRVLRKNGELGGFGGGTPIKQQLLRLEGVLFDEIEPQRFVKRCSDTV